MGTILVVDDEPTIRELLVQLLQEEGHTLLGSVDGVAAREILARTVPDLVLTDAMMPRLDGPGLVKWMREHPELRAVPVIILSAVVRIDPAELDNVVFVAKPAVVRIDPAELDNVVFVAKPFDLTTLLEAVETALDPPSPGP